MISRVHTAVNQCFSKKYAQNAGQVLDTLKRTSIIARNSQLATRNSQLATRNSQLALKTSAARKLIFLTVVSEQNDGDMQFISLRKCTKGCRFPCVFLYIRPFSMTGTIHKKIIGCLTN